MQDFVGKYQVLERIASGGMADVYRALMGKDVGGTSHQGVLPMKIGAYWTGHRVMGVRR